MASSCASYTGQTNDSNDPNRTRNNALIGAGIGAVAGLLSGNSATERRQHAMIGGASGVEFDVIPYGSVLGNRAHLSGLNIVGLKRRNFNRETIHTLRRAYRLLFAPEGTINERVEDVANLFSDCEPVMEIVTFVRQDTSRGICQPVALEPES